MTQKQEYLKITDGLVIYKRESHNGCYYLRAKIEGRKGYVIRSTQKYAEDEARLAAYEAFISLKTMHQQGLVIGRSGFGAIYDKFAAAVLVHKSDARKRQFEITFRRYFLPHFGEIGIAQVNEARIRTYWDWRISYYQSAAVSEEQQKAAKRKRGPKPAAKPTRRRSTLQNIKKPSLATLKVERGLLRELLKYAAATAVINRVPEIEIPKIGEYRNAKASRRDHFSRSEMNQIHRYLRTAANEVADPEVKKHNGRFSKAEKGAKKPHELHRYQRSVLRFLVLILVNTGLRIGEALNLKWDDLKLGTAKDGYKYLYVHVREGKTGARDVVCKSDCVSHFRELKAICQHTEPTDFVFQNRDGSAIREPGVTFKKMLKELGMLTGEEGNRRSLYSLRHTYVTNELELGDASMHLIANNAGTSIQYIERHYSHAKVHAKARELAEKAFGSKDVTEDMKALFGR